MATHAELEEISNNKLKLPLKVTSTKFAVACIDNAEDETIIEFELIEDYVIANKIVKRVNAYDELISFVTKCYKEQSSKEDHWIWVQSKEILNKLNIK